MVCSQYYWIPIRYNDTFSLIATSTNDSRHTIETMMFLLAILPVLAAVFLILILGLSAVASGAISLLLAIVLALTVAQFSLEPFAIVQSIAQGSINTIGLAYVLLGGVFLYQVLKSGGALEEISSCIGKMIPHPTHQVLVIVYGVSVFFESATGFGVGIIVTAPLLIALGYDPLRAAVLALIGQCAVSWGALAVGTILGSELSGVEAGRIGTLAAGFSFPYVVASGVAALLVSQRFPPWSYSLFWLFAYALTLTTAIALTSHWVGVELAGCAGGLAVILLGFVTGLSEQRPRKQDRDDLAVSQSRLLRSLIPLIFLMAALLLTRLIPPLQLALQNLWTIESVSWSFQVSPWYHPGTLLLLASLVGLTVLPGARHQTRSLIRMAAVQWFKASIAILGFLALGQLMLDSNMTTTIAVSLVNIAGDYYAGIAPVIGGLGGFITASNAASNALFMGLQVEAAAQLNLNLDWIATAQNVAGSNMTLASPGRLVFAAAIAGIAGGESALMRRVLPLALTGLGSVMIVSYLLTALADST